MINDVKLRYMIRIVSLNLRADANRWEERFPLVVQALLEANADIIALQEIRLKIEQHTLLADALNQHNEHHYQAHLCEDWYEPNILGNAFLARIPVIEHERIELPNGFRTAQRLLLEREGQAINIVNTHLQHKPYRNECIRLEQMNYILAWIKSYKTPFILVGDMNANPESETINFAKEHLQSAYEAIHGIEPDLTFPTPLRAEENMSPRVIDYIFCDDNFVVEDCELIGTRPATDDETLYISDHFGLVAELHHRR